MAHRSFSIIPALRNYFPSDRLAQIDNFFNRLTGENSTSGTPPYNLLQVGKEHYEMMISVPGYSRDELDVSVLNNQLIISGQPIEKEGERGKENTKYLHQDIKKNKFSCSFNLENKIKILQAKLDNGFLTLHFTYDVPEQEKPQKITIGTEINPTCD